MQHFPKLSHCVTRFSGSEESQAATGRSPPVANHWRYRKDQMWESLFLKDYAHLEQLLGKTHRRWLEAQPAHHTSLLQFYSNGITDKHLSDMHS